MEESQLDNYTDVKTLIGIEFDEKTAERGLFYHAMQAVLEITRDEELDGPAKQDDRS